MGLNGTNEPRKGYNGLPNYFGISSLKILFFVFLLASSGEGYGGSNGVGKMQNGKKGGGNGSGIFEDLPPWVNLLNCKYFYCFLINSKTVV